MKPLDCVLIKSGVYRRTAGVVERVERDEAGKVVAVVVDHDHDHSRAAYQPADLEVIKAH